MLSSLLLAAAFQIGPFYQQKEDYHALRPFWSHEGETTDVLWPLFTSHRDWWRFAYILNWHDYNDSKGEGYQFMFLPLWFNGRDAEKGAYAGLFPIYGRHPHILMAYDLEFALWPLWTRYKTPRPSTGEWLETKAVLFPLLNWRSDGSWAFWPLYGVKHHRESTHRYALWPIATWAFYEKDRDTSGAGHSWMFWPLFGRVSRERETQTMFLPPFFSWTSVQSPALAARGLESEGFRLRCPWPFFEYETAPLRDRISVFPLYENSVLKSHATGGAESSVTRFGWRLVEIYRDGKGEIEETRVFPFWAKGKDYLRVWPFWETDESDGVADSRFLCLVPIRWIPAVDRNWAKFWTLYESRSFPGRTEHSLFWGIIRWKTEK